MSDANHTQTLQSVVADTAGRLGLTLQHQLHVNQCIPGRGVCLARGGYFLADRVYASMPNTHTHAIFGVAHGTFPRCINGVFG
jgi:hypothetical protein